MPLELTAYEVVDAKGWDIVPASPRRDWMDAAPARLPYRCLPMVMANQAGWMIRCPAAFSATWNGGASSADLTMSFRKGDEAHAARITSHFGSGILTFSVPYLFRTAPGYGLHVRGPANAPKDGIAPLEGLVETDWAPYTFTMNWKMTRRASPVWFQQGEPICMVTPFALDALESFEPRARSIADNPDLQRDHFLFAAARSASLAASAEDGSRPFEKSYYKGRRPDGTPVDEHRSNFRLGEFARRP